MIYFLRRPNGDVKIGTTIRLTVRLPELRRVHGECEVLGVMDGSYADESVLHRQFFAACVEGEWFKSSPSLLDFIEGEGRPWDGKDEVAAREQIRFDADLIEKVRYLAAHEGVTFTEYINRLIRPAVEEAIQSVMDLLESEP